MMQLLFFISEVCIESDIRFKDLMRSQTVLITCSDYQKHLVSRTPCKREFFLLEPQGLLLFASSSKSIL